MMLWSPTLLSTAVLTCLAASSGSEQPRRSGGTAGSGFPPSSAAWLAQYPRQRPSRSAGSRRAAAPGEMGRFAQGVSTPRVPRGLGLRALCKAVGNRETGGWSSPGTGGRRVAAVAGGHCWKGRGPRVGVSKGFPSPGAGSVGGEELGLSSALLFACSKGVSEGL